MNKRESVVAYVLRLLSLFDGGWIVRMYSRHNVKTIRASVLAARVSFAVWLLSCRFGSLKTDKTTFIQNGSPLASGKGFWVVIGGVPFRCHVSKGNHKLGKTRNISKLAGIDCGHCKHCLKDCYVLKSYSAYKFKFCNDMENSLLFHALTKFEAWDLFVAAFVEWWKSRRFDRSYFRIDESGELLNMQELLAWRQIALLCPETRFYTYTKMKYLFEQYEEQKTLRRLENFVVRFSPWLGDEANNPDTIKTMRGCGYYVLDVSENQLKDIARDSGGIVCACVGGNTKNACERCGHACAYRNITVFERLNA